MASAIYLADTPAAEGLVGVGGGISETSGGARARASASGGQMAPRNVPDYR